MHELGHNLGRGHAGRDKNKYGDPSSNMGGTGNMAMATGPQKCFNGAEHIEFGWYKDHILHYNPIVDGSRMIKLVSFVDVQKAGSATIEPVIIKLAKYNIQYNQAKDFNMGTGMKDHVTIVTDKDDGVTWFLGDLRPEDQQFIFTGDNGKRVYVNYCKAVNGTTNTPDAVYIGIGVGGSACTTIPPKCKNRPTRIVRYGDDQQTRCMFVNAEICNQDALNRRFESTGKQIYNICQHQCAYQAQCEAI
jgi:Gametolysin peptidase M11